MNLKNKTVWITGGSSGIGLETAKKFLEAGANVALASRSEVDLKGAEWFKCDISDPICVNETYFQIKQKFGKLDILINNAGNTYFKKFVDTEIEDFDNMSSVNFRGVFLATKAVIQDMIKNGSGTIANILSVAVKDTLPMSSVYAATKSAVEAMSNSLRFEVRDKGINVINFYPGATKTAIWPPKAVGQKGEKMMEPSEVAEIVLRNIDLSLAGKAMIEEVFVKPQSGNL